MNKIKQVKQEYEEESFADIITINEGVQYTISHDCLQIILQPTWRLIYDSQSLIFFTPGITIIENESFYSRLFSLPNSSNLFNSQISSFSILRNDLKEPSCVGFNQLGNGNIIALNIPCDDTTKLYLSKEFFLCATEDVEIESKILPLKMSIMASRYSYIYNSFYFIQRRVNIGPGFGVGGSLAIESISNGVVFIQGNSNIFVKVLGVNEKINILHTSLIGFHETVVLSYIDGIVGNNSIISMLKNRNKPLYIQLTGPGLIYYTCTSNKRITNTVGPTKKQTNTLIGIIIHIIMLSISLFLLTKLLVFVETLDQIGERIMNE